MNDYQFIIEEKLLETYTSKIDPWFKKHIKQGQFIGEENINLKYFMAEHDDMPSAPAIIFVPGRSESMLRYVEVMYDFYRMGYAVYALDHRGQGYSQRLSQNIEMGYVDDFNNYVLDLKTFYDQIITPNQHDEAFIVAHSMGGCITALYIEEYPHDFKAAILLSPMFGILAPYPKSIAKGASDIMSHFKKGETYASDDRNWNYTSFSVQTAEKMYTHSPIRWQKDVDRYNSNPAVRIGGPSMQWVSQAYKGMDLAYKNADKVDIPTLLFQSGNEAIVDNQAQLKWANEVNQSKKSGNVELINIAGAYHVLLIEKDEYRLGVVKKIRDFITQHSDFENYR